VPPLRRVTLHADYTTENHGFVHPDYLVAGICLRSMHAVSSLIGGKQFLSATLYNNVNIYERVIKKCLHTDGGIIPVQGQDWYYTKYHEILLAHTVMNVIHRDKDAAAIEWKVLNLVERFQDDHNSGSLLEENGEKYALNPYQHLASFEKFSAWNLLLSYLLHAFGGAGEEPACFESLWDRLKGVYEYPYGSLILHRTGRTVNVFNWRSNVMAISLPENALWTTTPMHNNYVGDLEFDNEENLGPAGWENTSKVRFVERSKSQSGSDGFGAVVSISRGGGKLLQEAAFISMPGGTSVYVERFRSSADCRIRQMRTGKIGIRNEAIHTLKSYASGVRTVYFPGGQSTEFAGFYADVPDHVAVFAPPSYVNLSNEIGYILYGSRGVRYMNRHQYQKYTGLEDILILNDVEDLHVNIGQTTAPFTVLTVPNQTAEQTARAVERAIKWQSGSVDHQILEYDGCIAYVNFGGEALQAEASRTFIPGEMFSVYPGHYQMDENRITWQNRLQRFTAGYVSETGRFAFAADNFRNLSSGEVQPIRDLSIRLFVLANQAVIINSGSAVIRMTGCQSPDGRLVGSQELRIAPGACHTVSF
jgi:hypothetical protein